MPTTSRKQSGPTTKDGRQIAYDREMCITICERYVRGEDLKAICAQLPMPIAPMFMKWVQEHPEGRALYRCAENFMSDRALAKTLDVPFDYSAGDWANAVRAKLERGHPVDYIDRKYVPPDWNKVYPWIGDPPVWSTDDIQAYNNLRDEFTQMLKPDDLMQLTWTKEAVDATWECAREARAKNAEPQRQYVQQCVDKAFVAGQTRVKIEPATADDLSRGFRTGLKYQQALDMAQSRKIKRRDNALRQIARWRDGLGGMAKVLSDKFVSEQALAERYGGAHLFVDAETDNKVGEGTEPVAPPLAPDHVAQTLSPPGSAGEAVQTTTRPSVDLAGQPEKTAALVAPAGEVAQSVPAADPASLVAGTGEAAPAPPDHAPGAVPPPAPAEKVAQAAPGESGATGQGAPPPAPAQGIAQASAAGGLRKEGADGAPPRTPAGEVEVEVYGVTERINWVAWLTGAQRYHWSWLAKAGEKAFERPFTSKRELVRHLVLECKMVRPDEVCPLLAPWLRVPEFPYLSLFGAAANAASSIGASGETPGAASPVASGAGSAEVVPAKDPAGAQAAPSLPGAGEPALSSADDSAKAIPPPAPTREVGQAAPSVGSSARSAALPDKAAAAARRRIRAEEVDWLALLQPTQQSTGPAASGANGQGAPPPAPAQEVAQTAAEGGLRKEAADAAPPRTPAGEVEVEVDGLTERINWVAWLTGAQRYHWSWLAKAGEKAFERLFLSKGELLRHVVFERKMIRPDQVCPALAPWLQGPEVPSLRLFGVARVEARP
jgi:hypothetical protein